LALDNCPSSSQKFIKNFASPGNTKQPRVGIGKNMSDLTGGKGRTARSRQVVTNFGVLDKVQSNLSNKSANKVIENGINKFSFTAGDFNRTVKIEKYKLDKLLGKESNKSAVFSGSKVYTNQHINFNLPLYSKEKNYPVQRCGRNGRCNSPQPHMEMIRKGGYGSYTSSTLQTVSLMNTDSAHKLKTLAYNESSLCQTKFAGYEWQGGIYYFVQFEEAYDAPAFLSHAESFLADDEQHEIQKLLRGHSLMETNEPKFFLPKASLISVEGFSSIDICHDKPGVNLDVKVIEKLDQSILIKQTDCGEEFPYGEPGYALGLLDTPSFTAPCDQLSKDSKYMKSDEFTFGRGESREDGHHRLHTESGFSSLNNEFERQDIVSEGGTSLKEIALKGRKINTQREYQKASNFPVSDDSLPLSERQPASLNHETEVFFQQPSSHNSEISRQSFHILGLEALASQDRSFSRANRDCQDSAEDSERYNLYKNINVSDSEDGDCEIPRSDALSESESFSQKGKIYGRFDEGYEVESSQLFLDDELRTKYQSLLQNN
jgi:hypothetical protein